MMYDAFDLLVNIQREIFEQLARQDYFERVPIMGEDIGADVDTYIEDRILAALEDSTKGLLGVIVPTSVQEANSEVTEVYYPRIEVVVRWMENPIINRARDGLGIPAASAAVATNYYLNPARFTPTLFGTLSHRGAPIVRVPDDTKIIYDCNYNTHGGFEVSS